MTKRDDKLLGNWFLYQKQVEKSQTVSVVE
jgi:hypothetical protein